MKELAFVTHLNNATIAKQTHYFSSHIYGKFYTCELDFYISDYHHNVQKMGNKDMLEKNQRTGYWHLHRSYQNHQDCQEVLHYKYIFVHGGGGRTEGEGEEKERAGITKAITLRKSSSIPPLNHFGDNFCTVDVHRNRTTLQGSTPGESLQKLIRIADSPTSTGSNFAHYHLSDGRSTTRNCPLNTNRKPKQWKCGTVIHMTREAMMGA